MRTILFLGGNGFLGKNVLEHYYSHKNEIGEVFFIIIGRKIKKEVLPGHVFLSVDLEDDNALREVFSQFKIDEVFHFISTSFPSNSNMNIIADVRRNLLGTLGLLGLMNEFQIKKITYISSGGTVYGEEHALNYQEDQLNAPNNSYGVLKLTIENYIQLYSKIFNMNYLILRVSNPFGKFHSNEMNGLINIAIRKSLKNETIQIWGDGSSTKDYIFASDFAQLFWKLYLMNCKNNVINIGSGNMYSVNEILDLIKKLLPETKWIYQEAKVFDTKHTAFNTDKLKSMTSMNNTEIMDALQLAYQWEKNNIN